MRVLYFTSSGEDYLADSVLHGLRSLLGPDVVDYPKCDVLYKQYGSLSSNSLRRPLYGNGFTLYGLLEDIPVDRWDIPNKVKSGYFDLIIFSSIHRHFGFFVDLLPHLNKGKTIVLDGEDCSEIYPYAGVYWSHWNRWFLPRAHTRFPYFKREWTSDTVRYRWFRIPPRWLSNYLPNPGNLRKISFSIPAEKIVAAIPEKKKLFPVHIVDPEVAQKVQGGKTCYPFDNEADYRADLAASRFGITTRRGGWDCLRHYELAANACVPCFKNLDVKPTTCAPHGLDNSNSVLYRNYSDLVRKLETLNDEQYRLLQLNAVAWAKRNTTIARAKELLDGLSSRNGS